MYVLSFDFLIHKNSHYTSAKYVHMYINALVHKQTHTNLRMYRCTYVNMYVLDLITYVCIYVFVFMYIHVLKPRDIILECSLQT